MKKIILSISFIVVSLVCFGQYLNYGFRGAIGSANLNGEAKTGVSLDGGFYINVDLKDKFGIGTDILVGLRTGIVQPKVTSPAPTQKRGFLLTTLNVPVYVYFPFSKHINLEAGLNIVNRGIGGKSYYSSTAEGVKPTKDNITYGGKLGFMFGLKLKPNEKVDLGLRFMTTGGGNDEDGGGNNSAPSVTSSNVAKTSVVQFTFGYLINW